MSAKPFPIPVVAELLGPGSQVEDETLDYMAMPSGMDTYRAPALPEPEDLARHRGAVRVLRKAQQAAASPLGAGHAVSLAGLDAGEIALINQVLGEGEVSAQVQCHAASASAQVQESVFAGLWRVLEWADDGALRDTIQVGSIPLLLLQAASVDAIDTPVMPAPVPGLMNAPTLLAELHEHCRRNDTMPHVLNLTLLPLSDDDVAWLDAALGVGRVQILSRGYGNCRITNTRLPNTWRVTYFNSQDKVILDSIEISRVPDVACAAAEDLRDSAERLGEVLAWVES